MLLSFFRTISLVEGLSLISLFFIAMPLRFYFEFYSAVTFTGALHGVLFMTYFFTSLVASHQQKWSVVFWVMVLFSSVIPFAFIFLDRKLKPRFPELVAA